MDQNHQEKLIHDKQNINEGIGTSDRGSTALRPSTLPTSSQDEAFLAQEPTIRLQNECQE